MRILITSDLRLTPDNRDAFEEFSSHIYEQEPDVLIIAGNLAPALTEFDYVLERFADLPGEKAVLLGNHDLQTNADHADSQRLWEEVLPTHIIQHGYHYLEQQNLCLDTIGICGTIAWYDYSGRDTSFGYLPEQYEELKGLVNRDADHITWDWNDREFAALVQAQFSSRLDKLADDHSINHIIVITHFPVFSEAIVPIPDDPRWRFGRAYTFNLSIGRIIQPKIKVRHVVSGHIVRGGTWPIHFGHHTLTSHVIGRTPNPLNAVTLELTT